MSDARSSGSDCQGTEIGAATTSLGLTGVATARAGWLADAEVFNPIGLLNGHSGRHVVRPALANVQSGSTGTRGCFSERVRLIRRRTGRPLII